jgi:hypothetical protein
MEIATSDVLKALHRSPTYEALNEKLAILEVTGRGERAIEEGRVVSHKQATKRMSRWLK